MSDLTRRPGGRLSRRDRENRAYRLVLAGLAAGGVALVAGVLAILGIIGWGPGLLALLVAVACLLLFRRSVGR